MSTSDSRSPEAQAYRRLYKTARWRNLRVQHLAREPLCRRCRTLKRDTEATVVDHVKPHGGDVALFYSPSNLQSLCKPCHDGGKQSMERSGREYDVAAGSDGLPVDPRHPFYRE